MRTNLLKTLCAIWLTALPCVAQDAFRLWPVTKTEAESEIPTLTMYAPDIEKSTGAAVVICPGGSYRGLARHEGEDYARFLASFGMRAFVLKYRLGPVHRYNEITADAERAMRLVRHRSGEWNIDPAKIGIMGSSAGGHLASTIMTHFDQGDPSTPDLIDRESSRPDFGILCYPVISMGPLGHAISREQFLGPNPASALITLYSNELQVTAATPPCFLWHTCADSIVSVQNTLEFAAALRENGVPFDLHVYEQGRHGLGLGAPYPFDHPHPWTQELLTWLRMRGLIR